MRARGLALNILSLRLGEFKPANPSRSLRGQAGRVAGIGRGIAVHPMHRVTEEVHGVAQAELVLDVFPVSLDGLGTQLQFAGDVRGPRASNAGAARAGPA